jgi:hypothetical protein
MLDLAEALLAVINHTDAVYLYGLDTLAYTATKYSCEPFGLPLAGGEQPNPCRFAARGGTPADFPLPPSPSIATLRNRVFRR